VTDDGQIVRMTQTEYYWFLGKFHATLMNHDGVWDFPWKGPRSVFTVPDEPQAPAS
jgi:hypothetical protein